MAKVQRVYFRGAAFDYLSRGTFGCIFVDAVDRGMVIKIASRLIGTKTPIFDNLNAKDNMEHEMHMINCFTFLAPEYSCGPASKITTDEGYPGVLMKYGGETYDIKRSVLTESEKLLLCLNFIHMTLCISDRLDMEDVKPDCILFEKVHNTLKMKFADLGEWTESANYTWKNNFYTMCGMCCLLLRREVSQTVVHTADCIRKYEDDFPGVPMNEKRVYVLEASWRIATTIFENHMPFLKESDHKSMIKMFNERLKEIGTTILSLTDV